MPKDIIDNALALQKVKDPKIAQKLIEGKYLRGMTEYAEEFDISGKIDTNNPIYKFYEKDVARYLKNNYKAQLVTDDMGVTWWEVPIDKSYNKPINAFSIAGQITGAGATAGATVFGSKRANSERNQR